MYSRTHLVLLICSVVFLTQAAPSSKASTCPDWDHPDIFWKTVVTTGSVALECLKSTKVNHQDSEGRTHLHYAVGLEFKKGVEYLLENGANPNIIESSKGYSPLHLIIKNQFRGPVGLKATSAAELRRVQIAELLLDHGANPYEAMIGQSPKYIFDYVVVKEWGSVTRHEARQRILVGNYRHDGMFSLFYSRSIGCKPMLIFFGGLFDRNLAVIKGYLDGFYHGSDHNVAVKYYDWRSNLFDEKDKNKFSSYLNDHQEKYPFSPLVIIGHSYGGSTAYNLASEIEDEKFAMPLVLFTLAPVGYRKGLRSGSPWINVWTKGKSSSSDLIAGLGYRWQSQKGANKNIEFDGAHDNISEMFKFI